MEIIAHRGLCYHKEEENSIKAFVQATVMKCPMMELDVRRTKDNQLIVTHDPSFHARGHQVVVDRHNLVDLIETGYVVEHYFEGQLRVPTIPTLELVLDLFLRQIKINIELKGHSGLYLAQTLDRLVKNRKLDASLLNKITVSSFKLDELRDFREGYHKVSAGYLSYTLFSKGSRQSLLNVLRESEINAVHLSEDTVSEEAVTDFKEAGLLVRVYTVNDIEKLPFYERIGVDGIFTDRAEEFLRLASNLLVSNMASL